MRPGTRKLAVLPAIVFYVAAISQPVQIKIREYCQANQVSLIDEYKEFLSIPNIAGDLVNIWLNAYFILQIM